MKKYLLISIFLSSNLLFSQNSAEALVDRFFNTYKIQPEKAINDLYATNPWTKSAQADIDNIIKVVNGFTLDYMGNYYGNKLIRKAHTTDVFREYIYLVKYERQPLRFVFRLYKPDKKWLLFEFKIDDAIEKELDKY